MLFKNAFHLMVDNFSLNYKMLLYKIVVGIVTVALCAALLYPTLRMLATSEPLKELLDLIREFLRAVVSGNTEFLQTFPDGLQESLSALVAYIGEKTPNLVFAGTSVSEGNGRVVVTRIGMDTEFGKIAHLTQNMEEAESPLQLQLNRTTKQITVFAACMGVGFFALDQLFVGSEFAAAFIFSLGMVVAFIPEGLLPTVTLSLAMAVQRMSKRNALVKKLNSVETLGSCSVICTDKTGTLTMNRMRVAEMHFAAFPEGRGAPAARSARAARAGADFLSRSRARV